MSNVEFTTMGWDETLFKNTFETDWQIVQSVVSHQKPLTLFRKIDTLPAFAETDTTETLKYVDTRYGNRCQSVHGTLSVGHQKYLQKPEMETWLVDTEMEVWLQRQKPIPNRRSTKSEMLSWLRPTSEPGSVLSDLRVSVATFARQWRYERWHTCYPIQHVSGSWQDV